MQVRGLQVLWCSNLCMLSEIIDVYFKNLTLLYVVWSKKSAAYMVHLELCAHIN